MLERRRWKIRLALALALMQCVHTVRALAVEGPGEAESESAGSQPWKRVPNREDILEEYGITEGDGSDIRVISYLASEDEQRYLQTLGEDELRHVLIERALSTDPAVRQNPRFWANAIQGRQRSGGWDDAARLSAEAMRLFPEQEGVQYQFLSALLDGAMNMTPASLKAMVQAALDAGFPLDRQWSFYSGYNSDLGKMWVRSDDVDDDVEGIGVPGSWEAHRMSPSILLMKPMHLMVDSLGKGEEDRALVRRIANATRTMLSEQTPLGLDHTRSHWYHSLGSMYDKLGETDRAFDSWVMANHIMHRFWWHASPWSIEAQIQATRRAVEGGLMRMLKRPSQHVQREMAAVTPVLVLGFPRSGTTLVDRMLSRHPLVKSLGEESWLHQAYNFLQKRTHAQRSHAGDELPEVLLNASLKLTQASIDVLAQRSLRLVLPDAIQGGAGDAHSRTNAARDDPLGGGPGSGGSGAWRPGEGGATGSGAEGGGGDGVPVTHIVTCNNYDMYVLWLAAALWPSAKVVVVVRDPRDACLSCFQHQFSDNATPMTDLRLIGRHARLYYSLLHAYGRHLTGPAMASAAGDGVDGFGFRSRSDDSGNNPGGQQAQSTVGVQLLQVHYEDLVVRQREVMQRILDFVGLPWDERCLHPEEDQELHDMVSDNSAFQIKRGMHADGLAKWHKYRHRLQPLLGELGSLPQDLGYPDPYRYDDDEDEKLDCGLL